MPNIASLLKLEITRLSRREVRKTIEGTRKASAVHRRDIAALKRTVAALQRQVGMLEKRAAKSPPAPAAAALPERPVRFQARGLRSLRARLGLSAPQLARLLGVSEQSIYNWETRKATPRKEQLAAIIAMRGLGKREVQQRLEASAKPARTTKRRAARRK